MHCIALMKASEGIPEADMSLEALLPPDMATRRGHPRPEGEDGRDHHADARDPGRRLHCPRRNVRHHRPRGYGERAVGTRARAGGVRLQPRPHPGDRRRRRAAHRGPGEGRRARYPGPGPELVGLSRAQSAAGDPREYHRGLGPRGHRLLVRLPSRRSHRGRSWSVNTRVLILGAAGRDFHNFNMVYRDDPATHVVAFTRAQIPRTGDRRYPASLAGPHYRNGIPIEDEAALEAICRREQVDQVVFAYSDVPHAVVMHLASRALAAGADFVLLGPRRTMLRARVPVIAISAVRTGCGKSQTARWLGRRLRERGLQVAVLRHPMPYGDLERQRVQRFATREDLDTARCTAEEREEYEPHLAAGNI